MYANVTCNPPIGYPTVIHHETKSVQFNVILETSSASSKWEVSLWHNFDDQHEWQEVSFREVTKVPFEVLDEATNPKYRRHWFTTELAGKPKSFRAVSFTIKFRAGPSDGWKWLRDQSGLQDGKLIYQQAQIDEPLSFYLPLRDPSLSTQEVSSESPGSRVWIIGGDVDAAKGSESAYTDHDFCLPPNINHWFAVTRLWTPWIAPAQGSGLPLSEKDAILYSFLRTDGLHVVMLAISGIEDITSVWKGGENTIVLSSRNDRESAGISRAIVAVGKTFESANAAVMYEARKMLEPYSVVPQELQQFSDESNRSNNDVKTTWIQDWYDGFTYCTWNGLGQNLTEAKITTALNSLRENGIYVSTLIIDDNWQSLDRPGDPQWKRGWTDFEANKEGFPDGLAQAISTIRQKHPQISNIAVWHALLGYWGGISPTGTLAKKYKTIEVTKEPTVANGPSSMVVIDAEDVRRFYQDFYDFLASTGINAVKTDAQFMIDEFASAKDRRELTSLYYDTWNTEQLRHFYGKAISCMSQTPEILFHCQIRTNLPRVPVRNSDDFFPDIDDSHPWHIFCNAHNAVFAQHLNVLPDWDMFQTAHPWAGFHAAARCVSGGPIYITDEPGKHDVALIHQMTAKTIHGQTVVLRPSVVGKSTQVYIGYEEARLLKVGTFNGASKTGTSFLGVFNCRDRSIAEIIALTEFPGTEHGGEFIVRSHTTGRCSDAMEINDADSIVYIGLKKYGYEVLSAIPVTSVSLLESKSSIGVANLGLVGKMTGGAAVLSTDINLETKPRGRLRIRTSLKALGTLGIWLSRFEEIDLKNDLMVLISDQAIKFDCISKNGCSSKVLNIDIQKAWTDGGFQVGYSNEIQVEIFVKI